MSITDELRSWSRRWSDTRSQSLYEVADRIDEAHERALKDCIYDPAIAADYWEAIIAERYIELPKDKNGKTISASDTTKAYTHHDEHPRGCPIYVTGIKLCNGKWQVRDNSDNQYWHDAGRIWLIEPDTQEKIEHDAQSIADDWCDQSCDTSGSKECLHDGIKDLLRRQRELDGAK